MKADIMNVFTPAFAVGDPSRFAGRQEQLDRVSLALQSIGTQIVIYGNRGVGKSSLAKQLTRIAQGDMAVIDRLLFKPQTLPDYLVVNIECDDTVTDIHTLILRILTDDEALAPWLPYKIESKTSGVEGGIEANLKIIKIKGKVDSNQTLVREVLEQDIFSTFANAINCVLESKVVSGILFIIDEFDRIKRRDEIASVVRTRAADPRVKFALVGVGTTPQELILGHESIVRQISDGCVEMPPMSTPELREIFDNAHAILSEDGISFDDEAQDWIISIAKGHPYYVHLLGKHSLIRVVSDNKRVVTKALAQQVLADIANQGTAKVQETAYSKAIGHSFLREFILKSLAGVDAEEINTSMIYPRIASNRQIDASSISVYVGHLVSEKFGAVLEKTRDRHYRFRDSLFKAYACARPFQYNHEKIESDEIAE